MFFPISIPMVATARTVDLRGMATLLLLTSPPRTLRAVGGGSAAGPSHSRHFVATRQVGRFSEKSRHRAAVDDHRTVHEFSDAELSAILRRRVGVVPVESQEERPEDAALN